MSDSVTTPWTVTHQATWDFLGKITGVGCHFLLQCMKVKSESEVTQSCPTLSDPVDCSPPGSLSMGFSREEYRSGGVIAFSEGLTRGNYISELAHI